MTEKLIDQIGGPTLEGSKTEYTVLIAAVTNVIMIVLNQFFGIELPENLWTGLNTLFGFILSLTLGSRMSRSEEAAKKAVAAQEGKSPEAQQPAPGTFS